MSKLGALEKLYAKRMTNLLVERGKKVIARAIESKESGNITLNQVDAYGIIVYYNGKVQRSMIGDVSSWGATYRSPIPVNISKGMTEKNKRFASYGVGGTVHKGWEKAGIPEGTGYEWARMFVKEFGESGEVPPTGFALVVFNAAFYSKIQELGAKPLKHRFKIISQVVGDLDNIGKDFGAAPARKFGGI